MKATLTKLDDEVLTALCASCTCCLSKSTHCFTCHSTIPIETLCGCGNCKAKVEDYLERLKLSLSTRINQITKMKGRIKVDG